MGSRAENLAWLYDGLRAVDTVVAKALGVSEQAQSAKIETRLRQFIEAQWDDLADQAAKTAEATVRRGEGELVTEAELDRILATVDRTMEQWPGRVTDRFVADMRETYGLSRKSGMDKALGINPRGLEYNKPLPDAGAEVTKKEAALLATIKPSFDLVDEAAMDAFENHQVFWIGKHYKENVSPLIATSAKGALVQAGWSRERAGQLMGDVVKSGLSHVQTPAGFRGTQKSYFEGLVANAATVSRSAGHLRSFQKVGYNVYQIVNPGDHRTCEICNLMDGKEFRVSDGAALMKKVIGAKTPSSVKKHHPWLTPKTAKSLAGKAGPAGVGKTGALAKAGHSMPSFHYKCRCDIDITTKSEIIPFETSIGGGAKPATPKFNPALKLPKTKQLKPKPMPKPIPPIPPEMSVATAPSEFAWKASQLKRMNKTFGGAHRKWAYEAPDGSQWLFKPTSEDFRAYGDKVAERIAKSLGVPHAEMHVVKMEGKIGSIQKLYKDVNHDLKAGGGIPMSSLQARQLHQVQREHAFDWLIGNHDGHGGNLISVGRSGDLKGIDKGQLFKFYNKDSISFKYNPNKSYGEISYYNQQFEKYASGQMGADFVLDIKAKPLQDFLKKLDELSDEDFLAMIKPYSSRAARAQVGVFETWSERKFLDAALRRKKELHKTLETFYDEIEKGRRAALGIVEEVAEVAPSKAFTPIDANFVKQAREAEWAGKAVYVAGEEYEGMQFLAYKSDKAMFLEGKLREVGDDKFLAFVRRAQGAEVEFVDEQWTQIEKMAKSINYHLAKTGDGILPAHTKGLVSGMADMFLDTSESMIPAGKLKEFRHYKKELSKIITKTGKVKSSGIGKILQKYSPTKQEVAGLPAGAPKVRRLSSFEEGGKALKNGRIVEEAGVGNSFAGEVYEVDFGKGIRAIYVRHGDGNDYSRQGKLRLFIDKAPGKVDAKDINRALKEMEKMGLPVKLADKDDLELLYLIKVNRAEGVDGIAAFKPMAGKSVKANIKKLKTAWEKRLGKKLTKATGYEPMPVSEFLDGTGQGKWMSFAINVDELAKKDVGLYHSLYKGLEDLKRVLSSKTRSLISTEEKLRLGIAPVGMSPGPDMRTGGASYVFTRLRTSKNAAGHIRFHPGLMRDTDAVTHNMDRFGEVTESALQKRVVDQTGKIRIAHGGGHSNETIFKNSVSFERWLDQIKVGTPAKKRQVVKWFKDAGITRVGPNRKKIEDAVVIGGYTRI